MNFGEMQFRYFTCWQAVIGLAWMVGGAVFVGVLLTLPRSAMGQSAPAYVPVQGRLTAADGSPRSGSFTMTFRLYAQSTGGTAFYAERSLVEAQDGNFIAYLGDGVPADLGDGKLSPTFSLSTFTISSQGVVFLGISVDAEPELAPRLQFGSAPFAGFAQTCGDAATLGGMSLEQLSPSGDSSSGALTPAQIPDLGEVYLKRGRFASGVVTTPTDPGTDDPSVFDPKGTAPVTGTVTIEVPTTLGCDDPQVWVSGNTGGERNFISWSVRKGTLSSGGPDFVVDWINLYHEEGFDISFNWLAYCP